MAEYRVDQRGEGEPGVPAPQVSTVGSELGSDQSSTWPQGGQCQQWAGMSTTAQPQPGALQVSSAPGLGVGSITASLTQKKLRRRTEGEGPAQ